MSPKTARTIALAAAATLAAAFAAPASADEVGFSYDASELQSAAGVARLYERINDAADRACSSSGKKSLAALRAERACTAALVEDYVASIDNAALYAAHDEAQRYASAGR